MKSWKVEEEKAGISKFRYQKSRNLEKKDLRWWLGIVQSEKPAIWDTQDN